MDKEGFIKFLTISEKVPKGLSKEIVDFDVDAVEAFENDIRRRGERRELHNAVEEDVQLYIRTLVERGQNSEERLLALYRYARFIGNKDMELAIIRPLDGAFVLEKLSETIRGRLGQSKHAKVFRGVSLPELGSSPRDWQTITQKFMRQLEDTVGPQTCKELLLTGPHAGPTEWYEEERETFLNSKDIDDFLKVRHEKAVATLRRHMEEHTLFFNQEIDSDVLNFVASNHEMMGGVRRGNTVYETKIPYMAREYLRESDDTMKKYFYCHCPWVREAIRTGTRISPIFCYCSAGYHKKPWDVIFGRPVEVEVLNSILGGDSICRFAIKIPAL
ncbi:MAG: hypothetical protein JSV94_01655 [Methanobacteriota archaeon]|nr:MAG: hypothetical protein JSV94_01655 [Euryarchaeota archaeon]